MIWNYYDGRPDNTDGRQDNEIRVYDLLDSLGIRISVQIMNRQRPWKSARYRCCTLISLSAKIYFYVTDRKTAFYFAYDAG